MPSIFTNVSPYRSQATISLRSPCIGEEVVGDAVALAGRSVAVQRDCALPVEVHRRPVAVEVVEHWCQHLAAVEYLCGLGALPVHVDDEIGIFGEEQLLTVGVAAVGTVRVGVDQLPDCQAVGLLGRCDLGGGSSWRSSSPFEQRR